MLFIDFRAGSFCDRKKLEGKGKEFAELNQLSINVHAGTVGSWTVKLRK